MTRRLERAHANCWRARPALTQQHRRRHGELGGRRRRDAPSIDDGCPRLEEAYRTAREAMTAARAECGDRREQAIQAAAAEQRNVDDSWRQLQQRRERLAEEQRVDRLARRGSAGRVAGAGRSARTRAGRAARRSSAECRTRVDDTRRASASSTPTSAASEQEDLTRLEARLAALRAGAGQVEAETGSSRGLPRTASTAAAVCSAPQVEPAGRRRSRRRCASASRAWRSAGSTRVRAFAATRRRRGWRSTRRRRMAATRSAPPAAAPVRPAAAGRCRAAGAAQRLARTCTPRPTSTRALAARAS